VLLAAIVGAILAFAWGYVSHTQLELMDKHFQRLPGEDKVLAETKPVAPGMYRYPWLDMKSATDADKTAWESKAKEFGHGIVIQGRPEDASFNITKRLVFEFLSLLVGALILVIVGSGRGFGGRVMIGVLAGIFAWASQDLSYWIWDGFTDAYTVASLIDAVVGWTLASIGIAVILRPRATA
jgi:hypothetical protein